MLFINQKASVFLSLLLIIFASNFYQLQGNEIKARKINDWNNVTSFAINYDENHMVLSMTSDEKEILYESRFDGHIWSEPGPIDIINNHKGGASKVGGPSFYYDNSILYFHADYRAAEGGFNIYYSEKQPGGQWSEPVSMGKPINSAEDEFYPSMATGKQTFYFARGNPEADVRKPRRAPDCNRFYSTNKTTAGQWKEPTPLHDIINKACEYDLSLYPDGKTVYFSSIDQEEHRDSYNVYFAREMGGDNWLKPVLIERAVSDETIINPRIVGNNIYFLEQTEGWRETIGSIYKTELPGDFFPLNTIVYQGKVIDLEDDRPIHTHLTVFDPTTLKVKGVFYSNKQTGNFEIPLLDNENYIVDIRTHGYSFRSFQLDYRQEKKEFGPDVIKLFDKAELVLSIYDAEIFRPLEAEIWIEVVSDNIDWEVEGENLIVSQTSGNGYQISEASYDPRGLQDAKPEASESIKETETAAESTQKIYAETIDPGNYSFILPLGYNYIIHAEKNGFKKNSMHYSMTGDIIFSKFERNMSLDPIREEVEITIADSETRDGVQADVLITNLNREETIFFSAQDVKDGKVTASLRKGDDYEFDVKGAEGYSFHNRVIKAKEIASDHEKTRSVDVELTPLRAETSIRLDNIYFATNSDELTSESFSELDRVVDLILNNPLIVIEIAAHTDDVGRDSYNMRLSERRAQSVVNYLLDNDVRENRLVAKGYGMHEPFVPNTCDDNRALNRRVEFTILDILEEEDFDVGDFDVDQE